MIAHLPAVQVKGSQTITLTFASVLPLLIKGKFSIKFSDVEGGLQSTRAITRTFTAQAEAYEIVAVSLSAEGKEGKNDGGNEVNFGALRVGDYATQTLSIGNKGKYKIGYRFLFTRPSISKLVKASPMTGMIEAGTDLAKIHFVFCSPTEALYMVGNKHIHLQIFEPLTNEVVETFPLSISAHTKFNAFRLQPSKGVTFGAVRFDSAPKTKRVELRNEGQFELTYVVCGAVAETDEIDLLDAPAYAALARGTPTASRAAVLSSQYLQRLAKAGVKCDPKDPTSSSSSGGQGGAASSPAKAGKGKGKEPPAPAAGQAAATVNLIFDPDGIPEAKVPYTLLISFITPLCPLSLLTSIHLTASSSSSSSRCRRTPWWWGLSPSSPASPSCSQGRSWAST